MKTLKTFAKAVGIASAIALSSTANAASILFAHVDDYGAYVDDGNRIAQFLTNAGHSVTTRFLDSAVYNDYASFDQIFVYDLYSGGATVNSSPNHQQNYANIASWYGGLADQNLILDGRIISSDIAWTGSAGMPSEEGWIQNYATQLDLRGGGLVLGTDHNAYHQGINEINALIGVNLFHGNYHQAPLQATVDPNSPLHIAGLQPCVFDAAQDCINDNSSTGFVATGLQPNGQTLTPVAYHGNALDAWHLAAVSATMGSSTFGTCGNAGQPPCAVSEPSAFAILALGVFGMLGLRRRIFS